MTRYLFFLLLLQTSGLSAQVPAKVMPAFRFTTLDHRPFSNTDLPNAKLLLWVFFDPDCEHCQRALGTMDQHYKSFERAAVYLVSMAGPDKIRQFAKTYAPRLAAQKNVLLLQDPQSEFIVRFSPLRYPSFFLYSPEKNLLDYEDNEATLFRIERSVTKNVR